MKEASGELSMTAIAIVAIAALGVIFTTLVWPSIKNGLKHNTYCSQAFGCAPCANGAKTSACNYVADDGTTQTIQCPCTVG